MIINFYIRRYILFKLFYHFLQFGSVLNEFLIAIIGKKNEKDKKKKEGNFCRLFIHYPIWDPHSLASFALLIESHMRSIIKVERKHW